MFSYDERMVAIQHLIQNQFNYTMTVMELGYSNMNDPVLNNTGFRFSCPMK